MKAMIVGVVGAVLLAASVASPAQQTVYRWVDKDGKVQFSDTPPPPEAGSSTGKRMGGGYVEEGQLPYETQVAARRNPVVLYVSDNCADACTQARTLLVKRGIPFGEKNAQSNADAQAELKKLVGELKVPVLKIGANTLKGYESGSWQAALDEAGYARELLPGQVGPRAQ
ncbi:MAG TPA: glutaredoxin family protein [Usitatibacter sp.]|nr:glutaredoxin family protein [Usitatibacter sp.]